MYVLAVNIIESIHAGINKRGSEFHKLVLEVMAKQALVSQPENLATGDMKTATRVCRLLIQYCLYSVNLSAMM